MLLFGLQDTTLMTHQCTRSTSFWENTADNFFRVIEVENYRKDRIQNNVSFVGHMDLGMLLQLAINGSGPERGCPIKKRLGRVIVYPRGKQESASHIDAFDIISFCIG